MCKIGIFINIFFCLTLISCDLFKTRTPQEPSQNSSSRIQSTIDTLVLYNMKAAFRERNVDNYVYSFSDVSFTFEPTASALSTYINVFNTWNKQSEGDYFRNVVNQLEKNSNADLEFGPYTINTYSDWSQIEADYQLSVPHTKIGVVKNFNGRAQFTFVRGKSGEWFISKWIDRSAHLTDSTWSDLKGIFAP